MAVKKTTRKQKADGRKKITKAVEPEEIVMPVETKKEEEWGEPLDPQEEKVLDWILKGVVIFILGWLWLSILLVIGGYFGLWK